MAEQLMSTEALLRRGLISWIARAASSLPVPVAPVMSTEASVGATRSITEKSFLITGDSPMRVGVFDPLVLDVSCLSTDRVWLDHPSIVVGGARGVNQLNPVGQNEFSCD